MQEPLRKVMAFGGMLKENMEAPWERQAGYVDWMLMP